MSGNITSLEFEGIFLVHQMFTDGLVVNISRGDTAQLRNLFLIAHTEVGVRRSDLVDGDGVGGRRWNILSTRSVGVYGASGSSQSKSGGSQSNSGGTTKLRVGSVVIFIGSHVG